MAAKPRSPVHKPDVVRAFKAAEAAGVRNPRVEIICPNGTVIAISSGKPAEPPIVAETPFDQWISSHADQA